MEEWWEFELALFLAPKDMGSFLPVLWWFRTFWFWVPLISAFWTFEVIQPIFNLSAILRFPIWLMLVYGLATALSQLSIPHPPCQFLKIQEAMVQGRYFCVADGGLPEINSILLSGSLAYFWDSNLFSSLKFQRLLLFLPVLLSGLASVLLVQAFVSDVLTGMVLGFLLTFVVRKLRKRLVNVVN